MSALWPHPPYAEDQPHPHTILTTHVLHRGFQTGAILGSLSGGLYSSYHALFSKPRTVPSSPATAINASATGINASSAPAINAPALTTSPTFARTLLRATATGSLLGTAAMALMLPLRMRGRAPIEWQDRSWRLLENKGQVEVDSFSLAGMVLGGGAVWRATGGGGGRLAGGGGEEVVGGGVKGGVGLRGLRASWRGFVRGRAGMVVGGAGVGAGLGIVAYFGWRYGVHGGKWAEAVEEGVESAGKGVGVVR